VPTKLNDPVALASAPLPPVTGTVPEIEFSVNELGPDAVSVSPSVSVKVKEALKDVPPPPLTATVAAPNGASVPDPLPLMPVTTVPLAVPVKERLILVDAPLCASAAIARPRKRKITKVERRSRINEILRFYNSLGPKL
jgi:hypothetical protein